MNMRFLVFLWVIALACPSFVLASAEEYATWRSVSIDAGQLGEAKQVTVNATAGQTGINSIQISAFGRVFDLAKRDLEKIRAFPLRGLIISSEVGYKAIGGFTVYLKLERLFHDSNINKSARERATISIQHTGSPKITIEPVSVNGSTIEGSSCNMGSECNAVDCSKYDGPIKSEYKPECVDKDQKSSSKICRCFCRGCH